jgi:O-antigen/teichoic acid export membrane protein
VLADVTDEPYVDAASPVIEAAPDPGRAVGLGIRAAVLVLFLNAASGVELARGLGLRDRGALAAAMLWPMVAGQLGTLGIEESMMYHVAREPKRAGHLLGSGLSLVAVQSAVFGVITAAIIPIVLARQGTGVVVSALIFSLYIPLYIASITLNAVLNGLHRYSWFQAVRVAVGVILITVQTLLLVTGNLSVRSVVILWIPCLVLINLYVAWLLRRAGVGRLSSDRATMRRLFAYGIRSHASTVPSALNQNLDQLLISAFLTARQLGVYVIAVTMSTMTAVVGGAVAYATLPNVARLPDGPERAALARRMISLALLISAAVSLPVLLLAPLLIKIFFGSAFLGASDVARILMVGAVALTTNRALEAVLRGVGRPLEAGVAELIALGATAIGLAALLPTLGILGAGIASVIAYLVSMAWMTRRATRALGISATRLLNPDWSVLAPLAERLRTAVGRARHGD